MLRERKKQIEVWLFWGRSMDKIQELEAENEKLRARIQELERIEAAVEAAGFDVLVKICLSCLRF